ncbi:GYDIA family GHMP kinase [Zobellia sp. 1_MG-2023]|uniref:GYDIA family GHMP kinase n=1 Tax=Zobellia sp. 1_MG-2023 TaxID=3062626 RepID=UPI0026E36C08|nr:GYDIA family GHMP kinase [Zobellia sp. 1_MG-2023]MDO6817654.1 GYDIA family GHMP kinase [Zobellia sp. 1_MG-2023]
MTREYYSNGKLLLTGEYAILDGALGLAIPTAYGQTLKVTPTQSQQLIWKSLDNEEKAWFKTSVDIGELATDKKEVTSETVETVLLNILKEAKKLNPNFLSKTTGLEVETKLDFPKDWGLGSSSTLINNIAQWAEVDAFQLLWNAFSGSGYDIACAQNNSPILYQVKEKIPTIKLVAFNPKFKKQLFFVHLDKKQNSREGIAQYRKMEFDHIKLTESITRLTLEITESKDLETFGSLLERHEALLSRILQTKTIKQQLFPDYLGTIKSLGAWGGDFILAIGNKDTPDYFIKKGYRTVIPYDKMVL